MRYFQPGAHYRVALACVLLLILYSSCKTDGADHSSPPDPPALVIIGVDNSKTFERHTKFDASKIEEISEALISTGRGGTIMFKLIGNPSVKAELVCNINAYDRDCNKLSATEKIKCKKKKQGYDAEQKSAITDFIQKCSAEMKRPLENETDLNGFFVRAQRFVNQPHLQDYQKYIFVYSDGFHDIKTKQGTWDKTLDCSLLPGGVTSCVSGWLNPEPCSFSHDFTTPEQFLEFLKKDLSKKITKRKTNE
jgi:hypothetical protein